jgi:endogenous inhibitor of DNA gyrase (YacG/DUF329 family)
MKCPLCDKPLPADADPRWRPFCSQRCKMGDLGQWFAGRYSIPLDDDPGTPEPPPDPPSRQ